MQEKPWFYPRGSLAKGEWQSVVDSSLPGWIHTGLRVAICAGGPLDLPAGRVERLIVPLEGSFDITWGSGAKTRATYRDAATTTHLDGRQSVFDGPTDVLYLGAGTFATILGVGRIAVAEAPTSIPKPSRYMPKAQVPVELRGAGRSSRQVHNFGTPDALDASKLIVCEVITPSENWSSYPAHKHDEEVPGEESRLEEIYYFEAAVSKGLQAPGNADPFGMFATYSSGAGEIAIDATVRTGDIALVPFGYHGPAVAAPGYDLYYLNVMAGPEAERAWLIKDDPAQAWIRTTWQGHAIDPRLPYGGGQSRLQSGTDTSPRREPSK
jgi:5-deoxy-glucuronate isomerase